MMEMTAVAATIPLYDEIVFFVSMGNEAKLVKKYSKNFLGLSEDNLGTLFKDLGSDNTFVEAWGKAASFFQKTGEPELELSFFGFVEGKRVIEYISSKIKYDISKGHKTIWRGKMVLDPERVLILERGHQTHFHLKNPADLEPCEARLALQTGLGSDVSTLDVDERRSRLKATLSRMGREFVDAIEEKGVMKPKCSLCLVKYHRVIAGRGQEEACSKYRGREMCFKCGLFASEGCMGALREDKKCVKEDGDELSCNCDDLPSHSKFLHYVQNEEKIRLILDRYTCSFPVRQRPEGSQQYRNQQEAKTMSKPGQFQVKEQTLFVHGVTPEVPDSVLWDEFGNFGVVKRVFNSRKGFAFVTMSSKQEAERVINYMDGVIFKQKKLTISFKK